MIRLASHTALMSLFALAVLAMISPTISAQDATPSDTGEELWKIFENVQPSVVALQIFDANQRQIGQGSGFVVGDNGLIVTHLRLLDGAIGIKMTRANGDVDDIFDIAAVDTEWGIALLRATGGELVPLSLAQSGTTKIGQEIIAIGSPQGVNVTLSQGVILGMLEFSGTKELMQVSNEFGTGMNGGPVLDEQGNVIGMAVTTVTPRGPVNLAVPSAAISSAVASSAGSASIRNLRDLQKEIERTREQLAKMRGNLEQSCSTDDISMIDSVINNAIASGAGVYNAGDYLSCFRIYEGASYQMLYRLEKRCEVATQFLEKALFEATQTRSPGRYPTIPAAQAWVMRGAFDSLLGATGPAPATQDSDGDTSGAANSGT